MQMLLRDYSFEPGGLEPLQRLQESSPRRRISRPLQADNLAQENPEARSPRHVPANRTVPLPTVRTVMPTPAQRRRMARPRQSSSELVEFDRDVDFDQSRLQDSDWGHSDEAEPYEDPDLDTLASDRNAYPCDLNGD